MNLHFDLSKSNCFTYEGHKFTVAECRIPKEFEIKNDRYDVYIIMAILKDDPYDPESCMYYDPVPGTFSYGACLLKREGLDIDLEILDKYIAEHKEEIV